MMLSVFILGASVLANNAESLDAIRKFDAAYAKELAASAHLPELSASQDEVRVWSEAAFFAGVSGWVVTKSEIRAYSKRRAVSRSKDGDETDVHLERTIRDERRASRLLRKFAHLSVSSGKNYACGFDGTAVAIEGMISGQHFFLSAINPGFCPEPDAKEVARLFSELVRASRRAP